MAPKIRIGLALVAVCTLLLTLFTMFSHSQHDSPSGSLRLAQVGGTSLQGRPFQFPGDLPAARNLILFAYEREQADALSSWVTGMRLVESDYSWFELPVISESMRLASPFIDSGMRSGIPDPKLREHVVTIYTDQAQFARALGIPFDVQGAYAIVVDHQGLLVGVVSGRYNQSGGDLIKGWMNH